MVRKRHPFVVIISWIRRILLLFFSACGGLSPIKKGRNSEEDEATDEIIYGYNKHQSYQDCPHELPCKVKICTYCDKLFCSPCFNTHQEVLHLQNTFMINFVSFLDSKNAFRLFVVTLFSYLKRKRNRRKGYWPFKSNKLKSLLFV